jgi:hypothetical protein
VPGTGRLLGWAGVGCAACCALPLLGVLGTSPLAAAIIPASGAAVPFVTLGAVGIGMLAWLRRRFHAPEGVRSGAVCTLPPADRVQRTSDFRALFDGALIDRQRDAGGVRWILSALAQTEAESRRLAALEERCCDGIRIAVTREGDVVTWQITGPASAAATLDAFYDLPTLVVDDRAAELWARLDGAACGPTRKA